MSELNAPYDAGAEEMTLEARPDPLITLDMPGWSRRTFRASEMVGVSFLKEVDLIPFVRIRLRDGSQIEFDIENHQGLRYMFDQIEATLFGQLDAEHLEYRVRFFAGNERTLDARRGEGG